MGLHSHVQRTLSLFCSDFVSNSYLCYTEHGQHALFFTMLYNALAAEERYANWNGHKVCTIQKEYPTATPLGKSQRQHWDMSVLRTPLESKAPVAHTEAFDFLRLEAAIEFGLNADEEHLKEDVRRLEHDEANVEHGFIVHLYRLSQAPSRFSGRDLSPDSSQIFGREKVCEYSKAHAKIEFFYGMAGSSDPAKNGAWRILSGECKPV